MDGLRGFPLETLFQVSLLTTVSPVLEITLSKSALS